MADFEVDWSPGARRSLTRLPEKIVAAVIEFVYGSLACNPLRAGTRPLQLELEGLHSARRGGYRVIYRVDVARHRTGIVAIEHRSDGYRAR